MACTCKSLNSSNHVLLILGEKSKMHEQKSAQQEKLRYSDHRVELA